MPAAPHLLPASTPLRPLQTPPLPALSWPAINRTNWPGDGCGEEHEEAHKPGQVGADLHSTVQRSRLSTGTAQQLAQQQNTERKRAGTKSSSSVPVAAAQHEWQPLRRHGLQSFVPPSAHLQAISLADGLRHDLSKNQDGRHCRQGGGRQSILVCRAVNSRRHSSRQHQLRQLACMNLRAPAKHPAAHSGPAPSGVPEMMMAATGLNSLSRNSGSASMATELQRSSVASKKCGAATTCARGETARPASCAPAASWVPFAGRAGQGCKQGRHGTQ